MKFILIELFYKLNDLKEITFNTVRKVRHKYERDCLFKIKYHNENLFDIIKELIKKTKLERIPILINRNYDSISFLNINIPKMSSSELIKNIDAEINNLVENYKLKYEYKIDRLKSKGNKYRVILNSKEKDEIKINLKFLKETKTKKIKYIDNYLLSEKIISKYRYHSNVNYCMLYFKENNIEFHVINNGLVIEVYKIDIDHILLSEYSLSHNYSDLLNNNDQYFKSICDNINKFSENRTIYTIIMFFTDSYNEYLKSLIEQNINQVHYVNNYVEQTSMAMEEILNDK